jgi:hypothetical protein
MGGVMNKSFEALEALDKAELIGMLWGTNGHLIQTQATIKRLKDELAEIKKCHDCPFCGQRQCMRGRNDRP